jgi:hypothetical protein
VSPPQGFADSDEETYRIDEWGNKMFHKVDFLRGEGVL